MKLSFEAADVDQLADAVLAKMKAAGLVVATAAPVEPTNPAEATKPATKPTKAADKAPAPTKAAETAKPAEEAVTREDVLKAMRDHAGPKEAADYEKRKNATLEVLRKYSKTLAELPADKFQTVLDELKALSDAPAAPAEDEPF